MINYAPGNVLGTDELFAPLTARENEKHIQRTSLPTLNHSTFWLALLSLHSQYLRACRFTSRVKYSCKFRINSTLGEQIRSRVFAAVE